MTTKAPRRHGDVVTCAYGPCDRTFVLVKGAMGKCYCSPRCRKDAVELRAAERNPALSKSAKSLLMQSDAVGGTVEGGAMVSGTLTLSSRPVVDLAHIPEDRPELWT